MQSPFDSFYETILHHLAEGVCFVNHQRQISLWNHTAERITGFAPEEVLGTPCCDSVLTCSIPELNPDCSITCPFDPAFTTGTAQAYRLFHLHKEGHRILINLKVIPTEDGSGTTGAIGIFTDASSQTELEATTHSMQKLMRIDPLTRLPNKRALFDSMKGEYLRFARYGTPFALIAVAIDPDERLPRSGPDRDALVKWFAQQLSAGFRKADTPGRLRGASFMVLLPHANTQAAEKAAEKIRRLLLRTLYPGGDYPVTARFGCASISRSDTLDRLIDRSKNALKIARNNTGNAIVSL